MILRATLRQRRHDFDHALTDLQHVIQAQPTNAQAWLTQSVIHQVRGNYNNAQRSCFPLVRLTNALVVTTCTANTASLNGQAQDSYQSLRKTLQDNPSETAQEQLWAWTLLAEIAARLGHDSEAEQHFQQALSLGLRDAYLLGAYADFLLDQSRPSDVQALLQDDIRPDGLLLRLLLAEQQLHAPKLDHHVKNLRARFAENRLRNESRHLRDEARFTLHVLNDPHTALKLAQQNLAIQREPWDARILLEAALHSNNRAAAQPVLEWLHQVGLEDIHLERLQGQFS